MPLPKKIAVFTGSRADYSPLYSTIKAIDDHPDLELHLLVSGSHLSGNHGYTYRDIEQDGFKISRKIEIDLSSDSGTAVLKSMGLALIGFSDHLKEISPELIIILGDRFEALAMAQTAMILQIPIAHFSGGEVTQGAYDEMIRHSITKMSQIHFVATEQFRKRVRQLGENPDYIFNVGEPGLSNIDINKIPEKYDFFKELNISHALNKRVILSTYHPETAGHSDVSPLIESLNDLNNSFIIFTYPNTDNGGLEIINSIDLYVKNNPEQAIAFKSLGVHKYLSALYHCDLVIGNSSSAIIEAPHFKKPVINIGIRQQGRPKADCIIDCDNAYNDIKKAINLALSKEFQRHCQNSTNPYGDGLSVVEKVINILLEKEALIDNRFFDL